MRCRLLVGMTPYDSPVLAEARRALVSLELPVTGGVHLAAVGELTLLAGGPASLMALHEPALNVMGNEVIHMGPVGSASLIKVITNMLALVHLQVCGEALMLASRGGLDLATELESHCGLFRQFFCP